MEWKLVLELPMRVWNLSRSQWSKRQSSSVLELPMRVWNQSNVNHAIMESKKFWSYLWGFETDRGKACRRQCLLFWSYLWGFETRHTPNRGYTPQHVLELPMRVWNRFCSHCLTYAAGFGVTYEGLKRHSSSERRCASQFWSYLWGFETWHTSA